MDEVGISFFDNLKDQKNSTIKKSKSISKNKNKKDNLEKGYNLTLEKLAEQIKLKKDNPDFKEALKKEGINFILTNKSDSENSESSCPNILKCSICFNNTNDPNIKMEVCGCGHLFCSNCLNEMNKKNENMKCPICRKEINLNERRELFI